MAVPLKGMRPLTVDDFDKILADLDAELATTWAVYGEYDDKLKWKVVKIIPWSERDYDSEPMKIEGAVDALDAYKKVMERTL
jgi:inhibitor of KinA sporulation pathway (predicted exonuclease)